MERGETTDRRFGADGTRWRATVAWRAADGSALCYFRPVEGDSADGEPPSDRRARLAPGTSLAGLGEEALVALLDEAAPLTPTERRFRAPDGRDWLAQSVGPVWAGDEAAEGATGLLFTALDGEPERLRVEDGHAGQVGGDGLVSVWRRARDPGAGPAAGVEDAGDGG